MNKQKGRRRIILTSLLFMSVSLSAQYLSSKDYDLIKLNYPSYRYAAEKCGIPLEPMIAIHWRESRLKLGWYSKRRKSLVKNIGGPFMLDLGGEGTPEFVSRIRKEESRIAAIYSYVGDTRVSHNFEFACLVAAHYIKAKARYGLDTVRGVADMFWGYNGRYHDSYLLSSYVSSDPENGVILSFTFKGVTKSDMNAGCLAVWKELISKELPK